MATYEEFLKAKEEALKAEAEKQPKTPPGAPKKEESK